MKNKIITIFVIMILLICFIIPASSTRINFSNEIRISRLSNESTEFSNLNLELGDIVWRWVDADILVTDIIGDEYEFIESNGAEDVWVRTETEEWIVDNNIFDFVYRLKEGIASYSDIQSAINFAKSQEGKKFAPLFDIYTGTFHVKNSNPDDPNDYLSDDWYCTELIWAAFYNQGIDIDYNGGDFIIPIDIHLSPIFDKIDLID